MAFSFALCPGCLAKYRLLTHDPTCEYTLNVMPFCSLQWSDEHPEDLARIILDREHHEACASSIIRLVGSRTHLWRTGVCPEDRHELWAEAQQAIPDWPGFKRLSLDERQRRSLDSCVEELDDVIGAIAQNYSQITLTDEGGGLTKCTATRNETRTGERDLRDIPADPSADAIGSR